MAHKTLDKEKKKNWIYPEQTSHKFRRKPVSSPRRPSKINAELVEQQLMHAMEKYSSFHTNAAKPTIMPMFPSIRDCNGALAQFGDQGDMRRALRLFGKMRKAALLPPLLGVAAPIRPTLVTYSTLMSRFNRMSQPRVSLRLFRLLRQDRILPDTKACNILMNTYTRLKQPDMALALWHQMKEPGETKNNILMLSDDDLANDPLLRESFRPDLVTFNTLLDACSKVGDLQTALIVKQELEASGLLADPWTYTSLIATAAAATRCTVTAAASATRKEEPAASSSPVTTPSSTFISAMPPTEYPQDALSLAFDLFEEMKDRNISPNGMTYSALIDVAAKARRSDLALQGLRNMLRHKKDWVSRHPSTQFQKVFGSEVGAWTAAINACGKVGRWETAVKLFYAMPSFGAEPNTITCGCLTDTLLRYGQTAEALQVLRYMKAHNILPSEVMYTSLMTRAERLAKSEDGSHGKASIVPIGRPREPGGQEVVRKEEATAIQVYFELMMSLIEATGTKSQATKVQDDYNTVLLRVFLVFQEMKSTGVEPDLACFNALLRACARAADIQRAQEVLERIHDNNLVPNDSTWRQLLATAGRAGQSQLALSFWRQGLLPVGNPRKVVDERPPLWIPSIDSFSALVLAYHNEASNLFDKAGKATLFRRVVVLYERLLLGDRKLGMDRMDLDKVLENPRAMLLVLEAYVNLAGITTDASELLHLRKMGASIARLDCLSDTAGALQMRRSAAQALETARLWQVNR